LPIEQPRREDANRACATPRIVAARERVHNGTEFRTVAEHGRRLFREQQPPAAADAECPGAIRDGSPVGEHEAMFGFFDAALEADAHIAIRVGKGDLRALDCPGAGFLRSPGLRSHAGRNIQREPLRERVERREDGLRGLHLDRISRTNGDLHMGHFSIQRARGAIFCCNGETSWQKGAGLPLKTCASLYARIADYRRLLEAWKLARQGKRYKPSAAHFERSLDIEISRLYEDLSSGTYQPGIYRSFTVHDPKRRKISAAPFRDRVVHHALCKVLIPIYERKFIFDSYANRKAKGTHKALDRCTHYLRRFGFVLQCDVQQFFPGIDHALLKEMLRRVIADAQVIDLCDRIIDSGRGILDDEYTLRLFPGDDLFSAAERPRGLPIGNLTSQFWANVYLNELDQFVKHTLRCKGYVRYVDDFLLFADDKATLHRWRDQIIAFLQSLRLTIHENRAHPRPSSTGVPFLGFHVFPDHRRLKRRKGIAYRHHLHTLYRRYAAGEIERDALDTSVRAWVGHVAHGDTWGLRKAMFEPIILNIQRKKPPEPSP